MPELDVIPLIIEEAALDESWLSTDPISGIDEATRAVNVAALNNALAALTAVAANEEAVLLMLLPPRKELAMVGFVAAVIAATSVIGVLLFSVYTSAVARVSFAPLIKLGVAKGFDIFNFLNKKK